MKTKNLVWLGVYAVAAYYLYKKFYAKPTPKTEEAMKNFMYATGKQMPGVTVGQPKGCAGQVFYVAGSTPGMCKLACEDRDGMIIFPSGSGQFPCPAGV